jgi:uncharacterized protein (TIGR00251 family)
MHQYFRYDIKNKTAKFNIKLKPSAKQDLIQNYIAVNQKYYLRVQVQAPKIDGKANGALLELLSKNFQIKCSDISISRGFTSQYKSILIKNIDYDYLKIVLRNYIQFKQLTIL